MPDLRSDTGMTRCCSRGAGHSWTRQGTPSRHAVVPQFCYDIAVSGCRPALYYTAAGTGLPRPKEPLFSMCDRWFLCFTTPAHSRPCAPPPHRRERALNNNQRKPYCDQLSPILSLLSLMVLIPPPPPMFPWAPFFGSPFVRAAKSLRIDVLVFGALRRRCLLAA